MRIIIRKLYITLGTLVKVMTTINVSDDTRVKVVRRKDEVLTSQDKVIQDLLKRAEIKPVADGESCFECDQRKKELEKSEVAVIKVQTMYNNLVVEYKAVREELTKVKADIEPLESVSDVVVLDENNEILG